MHYIELYQAEYCPFCQRVRRELERLGLSFVSHPRENDEIRQKMIELAGKTQVPMLVDPNKDVVMYESEEIIDYLRKQYEKPEDLDADE